MRKLKNRVDSLRNQAESNAAILNDLKAKMANVDDEVGKDEADGPILKVNKLLYNNNLSKFIYFPEP